MQVLPKSYSQFRSKQYWDRFFAQREGQFEWYGEYSDFKIALFRILAEIYNANGRSKLFPVFHLGCGNSAFCEQMVSALPMYDISVVNCDSSELALSQASVRSRIAFPAGKMVYEKVDLLQELNEKYHEKFRLVIDKGTLDALLPQDKFEMKKQIREVYFRNVQKSLKPGESSYVLISMLQSFVLRTVLEHFLGNSIIIIHESFIQDSQMQPFLIDIRFGSKAEHAPYVTLRLLNGSIEQIFTIEIVLQRISELQCLSEHAGKLRKLLKAQRSSFNVLDAKRQPKYLLDILDSADELVLKKNNCAVFIVPYGKGSQQPFSTESGLKEILKQVGTSRLIVAKIETGSEWGSAETVKNELNQVLPGLIQHGCDLKQVPYLTGNEQLGRCLTLYIDKELSIEEVLNEGQIFRRLVLKNSTNIVQSQYRIDYFPTKQVTQLNLSLLPAKEGMGICIDHSHLQEQYAKTIVSIAQVLPQTTKVLTLGGGGCVIPQFLFRSHKQAQLVVEISAGVIAATATHFQCPNNSAQFRILQGNALSFMATTKEQFGIVIVDINGDEGKGQQFPPQQYFEESFLRDCQRVLVANGVLIINVISQCEKSNLKEKFRLELQSLRSSSFSWLLTNREEDCEGYIIVAMKQESKELFQGTEIPEWSRPYLGSLHVCDQ